MNRTRFLTAGVLLVLLLGVTLPCVAAPTAEVAAPPAEQIRITGWYPWTPAPVTDKPSFGDQVIFQEIRKKFNITIDWTVAGGSDLQAQLGLLIASGDLPDIVGRVLSTQLAQEYGRQGAFIALEKLIAERGPNLTAQMQANAAVRGQLVSPDGHIYFFPRLVENLARGFPGYQIRRDWLDSLKLAMPDTMADLETVLRAFRDRDPNGNGAADEKPWGSDPRALIWPFGVGSRGYNNNTDMFVENKTVKYGPTDPRYKDAVTLLARWYAEKLIDSEYLGQPSSRFDTLVLQDAVGSMLGSYAGQLTRYNKLFRKDGKTGLFVAMPPPMGPTGVRSMMGCHMELDPACGAAITVKSRYPERIAEMLDYFYSWEGRLIVFFGREGEHYTLVNGDPVFTDLVAKHPTLVVADYINTYVAHGSSWPSMVPTQRTLQNYDSEGREGVQISSKYMGDRKIPVLQFAPEEIKEVQTIGRDVDTYVDEWLHAFIRGQKPMGEWQAFQDGLKRLNTDRLTALYQAAYQRFLKAAGM